jgi:hypothetical protein
MIEKLVRTKVDSLTPLLKLNYQSGSNEEVIFATIDKR